MIPHFLNNQRPARAVGVTFTLMTLSAALLFIGLLFIGMGVAADVPGNPTDPIVRNNTARNSTAKNSASPSNSTETRAVTLFPGDGSFLASLRFWERNKEQSRTTREAGIAGGPQPPLTPPSITPPNITAAKNSPTEQTDVPTAQKDADSPPVPPSPYPDRQSTLLGDAPLPGQAFTAYGTGVIDMPLLQDVPPHPPSHVSYSFDTRDWVDRFSLQGQQREETVHDEAVMAIQTTSYRLPTMESPLFQPQPVQQQSIHPQPVQPQPVEHFHAADQWTTDQWNGTAIPLALSPITSAAPEAVPSERPQSGELPVKHLLLNVTPSYQKRLQYTQTCGVVVVQANFPLTEIASILDEINQLQHNLTHYIGVPAPQEKIELCLFKDETSYMEFLKEYFPRAPRDRRALYVKLDGKPGTLLVQKSKHFEVDLRHEMTHAIIHASIPKVPIWLDEGLAKYFEVPMQDRVNNHPYLPQVRRNARLGMLPSLDRLAKLETIDDMGAREYQDSWAWVHFLIHRSPETHQLLAGYLHMLANWNPDEQYKGTTAAFGLSPSNEEGSLRTIFERIKTKQPPVPSLKLYLDDIIPNQREAFKEHFDSVGK